MDFLCHYVYKLARIRLILLIGLLFWANAGLQAQFLMDMLDTTKDAGKGLVSMYRRFDHLRIGGYIQSQYQKTGAEGAEGYSGGNFSDFSNSRLMLRRGRIRFDYARYNEQERPALQFVFQFDGTERGVFIRDFWGRIWDRRNGMFSITTGMFARPFGYEVNLSSSDREAPERGRMSQILLKTERDLGIMASLEPLHSSGFARHLKIDIGIFNGQGLTGPTDFDSFKDVIGQVVIKPFEISPKMAIGGGLSILQGGMRQFSSIVYRMMPQQAAAPSMRADSMSTRPGSKLPRRYQGANLQWKWKHSLGTTQIRAEIWKGEQTATLLSSETPGIPVRDENGQYLPAAIRQFRGGFLLFLQNIGSSRHQLGMKYDWYDPNTKIQGIQIHENQTGIGKADIRFSTFGFGYNLFATENLRLTLWYDRVVNEKTKVLEHATDIPDDVLTARLQYRF